MKNLIIISLLSVCINAQTLLNETFGNFVINDDSARLSLVFDDTYLSANAIGAIDSLHNDWSGTIADGKIVRNGWSNYQNMLDSLVSGSPLYFGGKTLAFDGVDAWLQILAANATALNMGAIDEFTIVCVFKLRGAFTTDAHQYGIFSKERGILTDVGYVFYLRDGGTYKGIRAFGHDGSTNFQFAPAINQSANIKDDDYHVLVYTYTPTSRKYFLDGVEVGSETTSMGSLSNSRNVHLMSIMDSANNNPILFFNGWVSQIFLTDRAVTNIKDLGYLANGWKSLNGGVTRSDWQFHQGVVNDTIYYNTPLTAGSWTVSLSDSAASGVSYEVLTGADATTWTTLATGTTGTSWGSKSYSGTGSGYIAVSVASGTAFFDDLIVTRGNNNKFKYNKHSIHSTYLK